MRGGNQCLLLNWIACWCASSAWLSPCLGLVELKTTTAKSLREVAGVELLDSLKTWHTAMLGLLVVNILVQLKAAQFVRDLTAKESADMTKTKEDKEETEAEAKASSAGDHAAPMRYMPRCRSTVVVEVPPRWIDAPLPKPRAGRPRPLNWPD